MNKFLKENWFKLGIFMLLFIVTASIFYYFVFFLPSIERNKIEQAQVIEGIKLGQLQEKRSVQEDNSEQERLIRAQCYDEAGKIAINFKESRGPLPPGWNDDSKYQHDFDWALNNCFKKNGLE